MDSNKSIMGRISSIIFTIIYIIFSVFINRYNILPFKYRALILAFIFVFIFAYLFLQFRNKKSSRILKVLLFIFLLVISFGEVMFISYAQKSINTVDQISSKDERIKKEMSYVVLNDSYMKDISEIDGKDVSVANSVDKDNTKKALESLENISVNAIDYNDYISASQSLIDGESEVLLLNESFRSIVEDNIEGFSENTRVLKSFVIEEEKKNSKKDREVKENESFNVYISGIDTYGSLTNVSRSDVNLIVSVNPSKAKILITTIPRDTYLMIGEMGYDKLTHAGLFGVDTSIESLENFFDIGIDYYGKVNFTTLKELVDTLGGISVENPVAFSSTITDYYFPQGEIFMDGDMALAFARERYHLEEGDFDRGRNHTRIITGIINKMLSPELLLNFNGVANIALQSVNTDMSYDKMIELVNNQIDEGKSWDIESQSLVGEGSMELDSLLMPNARLYMMVPNEDSINEVRENILENNK